MIDLHLFRRGNKLTQKELADYLDVTRGYLSQVETGKCNLSEEKLKRLLENDRGWDSSMLVDGCGCITQSIGNNSNHNTQVAGGETEALREKITMLEKLLEEKERTIQILLDRK